MSTNPDNTDGELLTAVTGVTGGTIVDSSPEPAQILTSLVDPRRRYAVAVTEQHGIQFNELDDTHLAPNPLRADDTRTVSETLSFLDELDRRPLTAGVSTLWGDHTKGRIVAVYNDHSAEVAGWRDDRLVLQLVADRDWAAWHAISGKWYSQAEFGDVVEDLLHTVVAPDQADLLEIIDTVRATTSAEFASKIDRHDGSQSIAYSEDVKAAAGRASRSSQLEVPKTVTLRLRPWDGHVDTLDVEAYFRLRVNGGQLALAIKLRPTDQIVREAWASVVRSVTETTGIPVLAHRS